MMDEMGGEPGEKGAQFRVEEAKGGRKRRMAGCIAGRTAAPGRRRALAGAIVSGGKGDAESKSAAMEAAGIKVSASPSELGTTLAEVLKERVCFLRRSFMLVPLQRQGHITRSGEP